MSSVPARFIGWLATMPIGRPPIGGEGGHDVARPARAHLEQRARRRRSPRRPCARRSCRSTTRGSARRLPDTAGRPDRRAASEAAGRRRDRGGRPAAPRPAPRPAARSATTADGSPALRSSVAGLPSSSLVISMPVNWRTIDRSVDEGVGVAGHHDEVHQPEQQRRARTPPGRRRSRTSARRPSIGERRPPRDPSRGGRRRPRVMSAPVLLITATSGMRSSSAVRAATSNVIVCQLVIGVAGRLASNSTHDTGRSPSMRTRADTGPGRRASRSTSSSSPSAADCTTGRPTSARAA